MTATYTAERTPTGAWEYTDAAGKRHAFTDAFTADQRGDMRQAERRTLYLRAERYLAAHQASRKCHECNRGVRCDDASRYRMEMQEYDR